MRRTVVPPCPTAKQFRAARAQLALVNGGHDAKNLARRTAAGIGAHEGILRAMTSTHETPRVDQLLTVDKVAERLRWSRQTVHRWRAEGRTWTTMTCRMAECLVI
jgi:Homeodomain-like domain-containing protein